jgi:nicotinate-nucleotide adenylyltransferase
MEIAIFGTSADPPTIAHQRILAYLANHYDLVAVYASNNPFKTHGTNLKHRSRMLELLITELNSLYSNIVFAPEISDQRTINTIAKVKQKWGEHHILTVVIGADLSKQIFSWYQAEKLWQNLKVLLIPRDGYQIEDTVINQINQHSLGCSVAQCQTPAFSSTDYRHYHDQQVLNNSVKAYIEEYNLYFNDSEAEGGSC